MADLFARRHYTLLLLCSLFIFFRSMVMATAISSHQHCITGAGAIIMAGYREHLIGHSISYWRIFCTGKFKEDAYPGSKELESFADLSFVCSFYSIFK